METWPNFVSGNGKVKYRFTGSDCVITVDLLLSNDGLNERVSILRIVCWIVPGIDIQLPEIKGERERERAFNGNSRCGNFQLHLKIFQKHLIKYRFHRVRDLFNREEELHHFYCLVYRHGILRRNMKKVQRIFEQNSQYCSASPFIVLNKQWNDLHSAQ